MKYKLAIFDLDGTVLNTLDDLAGSLNRALQKSELPTRTLGEVREFVGHGIFNLVCRGVPNGTPDNICNKVFEDFKDDYRIHSEDNTKPYAGILDVLKELKHSGVKLAVVSNKADSAVKRLCHSYFRDIFDIAIGEKDGICKKPAPDSVNSVLTKLEIDRSDAVYIGDSEVDIETAHNACIPCISVSWGFRDESILKESGAVLILLKPNKLLEYI